MKEIDAGKIGSMDGGTIIVSYDPARKQDRSGYCVLLCIDGKAKVIESGEVPMHMKEKWENQAKMHVS